MTSSNRLRRTGAALILAATALGPSAAVSVSTEAQTPFGSVGHPLIPVATAEGALTSGSLAVALLAASPGSSTPATQAPPPPPQPAPQPGRLPLEQVPLVGVGVSEPLAPASEHQDPDLPPFARGTITKAEYMRLRHAHLDMLRGLPHNLPYNPRVRALRQMERQIEEDRRAGRLNATTWTSIGPAPIPNGQTTDTVNPVSGRVTSIAVHPANPDIVFVGTAQGGVYRSLNGGAAWTAVTDSALSLAIGAVAFAPSDPTIVYVGTGESSGSGDSFYGVGLYRIDNALTTADLTGPIDPLVTSGVDIPVTAPAFGNRAISEILVHPTLPGTIFVATADAIGGNPFVDPPLPRHTRGLFRSTNATAALASIAFQKLTVTQAGSLDVPGTGDRTISDIVFEPGNPNVMVAWVQGVGGLPLGGDGGAYRSTNALAATPTFTQIYAAAANFSNSEVRGELAINKVGTTVTLLAATGEATDDADCSEWWQEGRVIFSTDGIGAAFSNFFNASRGFCGGQCIYDIAVAIDPASVNTIHLGGASNFLCSAVQRRSTDAGITMPRNDGGLHADTHAIVLAPSNSNIVYAGNDGGIFRSTDAGATWTSLNNAGFNATQFQHIALHPTDPQFMIGGTQDNGTPCLGPCGTNTNPNAWVRADPGDGGYALIDQNATNTTTLTMYHTFFNFWAAMGFARVTTSAAASDGNWTFFGCGFIDAAANGMVCGDEVSVLFYAPMALGPGNPNTVYFGSDRLWRSTNMGTTGAIVSQAPIVSGQAITSIAISPQNDNVRVVGLRNGNVWRTLTGAQTLINVTPTGAPTQPVGRVAVDPNDPNVVYVTYGGYGVTGNRHVYKTVNFGAATPTWTISGVGIPDVPVNAFVIDPRDSQHLYAGTDIGVHRSTDGGANWSTISYGLPRVAVFDIAIQRLHRILRIATHGRGIWEISLPVLGNSAPTISDIANQTIAPNTSTGAVTFTVGDLETAAGALTLLATSTNAALVPPANVVFGGSGVDRTVTVTPVANQRGTTTIAITVSDGALTTIDSFQLRVQEPPAIAINLPASSTATSPFVTIKGTTTAQPDLGGAADGGGAERAAGVGDGAVMSVTWTSSRGGSGTATGTASWSAEVPLVAGANVITFTATDVGGLTTTTTTTINVSSFVYYFAEGATGSFFDLELLIANPTTTAAPVQIQYLKDDGMTVNQSLTVAAQQHVTILVDAIAGLSNTAVSSVVTSTSAIPLAVERTMRWDASGYGAHTEKATSGAHLNWFFAEGSQGFFDTFILLANPQPTANVATVTFLRESGGPVTRTYDLLPTSRTNVHTGAIPELVGTSFGVTVAFSQPGVAERAMYFGTPLFNGGHESAGVNEPATSWFLAEGAVGDFFDTFVLVSNPNAQATDVTFTFLRDAGEPVVRTQTIAANARATVHVDGVFPGITNGAVATQVTSSLPVVVERAMYWPGSFTTWFEAHNAFGVTATARRWTLGEGRKGGAPRYATFILLANPGATPATVTITYLREGRPIVQTVDVPAASRFNVDVNSVGGFSVSPGENFGVLIDSTVPIAVERAMYSDANGVTWAAGTNATGTRIP